MERRVGLILGGVISLSIILWVFFSIRGLIDKSKTVYIYNPLDVKMIVDIGDEHYELSPNKLKEIEIEAGRFKVKSALTNDVILDTFIRITPAFLKKGGLINLSGEPLYKWSEYYGSPALEGIYSISDDPNVKSPLAQSREQSSDFFKIDTTWLYGIIQEYGRTELVIEKSWDFNTDEDFSDEIPAGDNDYVALGKTASKLFDKQGMLDYWYQNYPPIVMLDEQK